MGEIKLAAFSLGKRIWWFPLAFSPCGVQGKLKFLINCGFIVSLRYYFVYTRNCACVHSIWWKFGNLCIPISLSFSFVVLHTSFLLYSMQFSQREYFFRDGTVCKSIHLCDRVNKYSAKFMYVTDHGWILCISTFYERDTVCCLIVSNRSRTHVGWWCRAFFFF